MAIINADIKGIIRELNVSVANTLYPFYEGVVNSIQAIDEREDLERNAATIDITITRDKTEQSLFENFSNYPISSISIKDNGIGFNEDNFKSFITAHSTKKSQLGGKGLGRFTMLAIFKSMKVSSVYKDKDGQYKKIKFELSENGVTDTTPEISETIRECGTTITLTEVKEKYLKETAKFNQESIADSILKHCLLYYLSKNAPKIRVIEDNIVIDLDNQFNPTDFIKKQIDKTIGKTVFRFYFVKNTKFSYHELCLCAHNRKVKSKKTEKVLPLFSSPIFENGESYYLTTYIVSSYLDKKVNIARNGFEFPKGEDDEETPQLPLDNEKELTEKEIDTLSVEIIRELFEEEIKVREEETVKKVESFLSTDEGLGYRHITIDEDFISKIPNDADNNQLEDLLYEQQHKKSLELRKKRDKLFKRDYSNSKDYQTLLDEVVKSTSEEGANRLAQYVAHRKTIIELLERYLQWSDETHNYEQESVLHNLIYTMGGSDKTIPYDKHNLWLLDDRLSFHRYIYSDKQIKSHIPAEGSESLKETDIAIYDVPFVYGEKNDYGEVNSVVLFELKRPDRVITYEEFSKQMREQISGVKGGKQKDYKGQNVVTNENTPVFFYYVCDANAYTLLKESAVQESFTETPYHSLLRMPGKNVVQEILSYQTILVNAKRRNKTFFERLGIDK